MSRLPMVLLLAACSDYKIHADADDATPGDGSDSTTTDAPGQLPPGTCSASDWPAELVGLGDACPDKTAGGFDPIVEWSHTSSWGGCLSLPAVGDLDGDGLPEIVVNVTDLLSSPGSLVVLRGDGSGVVWQDDSASLGYAASPALADLDGDGQGEIIVVREHASSMWFQTGDYTVVAYDATGQELWESAHFEGADFAYAANPAISDMDHDGSPEIVVGRVILNTDGTTRGVGSYGKGAHGDASLGAAEGAMSAITDLDRDGIEEVVVGDAIYAPDGTALWSTTAYPDGMISIVDLDEDEEGEFIAVSGGTIRAHDTDGSLLWGPLSFATSSTLSSAAIADLDRDGWPEITFAGRNELITLSHDGTTLWTAQITDESGATGPSIFDFEGDGYLDVVHIDEVSISVYDGTTGLLKFASSEHSSNTMFDYAVIADVDDDDQAEIVACHNGYSAVLSVYGDSAQSWAPARPVWNQHAYGIDNINTDLSVPQTASPSFTTTNTWHSAAVADGTGLTADLEAEILDVCTDECDDGVVYVSLRALNRSEGDVSAGLSMALYAQAGTERWLVATTETETTTASAWSSDGLTVTVAADDLVGAESLVLEVDDDGTGTGSIEECSEENSYTFSGPFCEEM